MKFSTPQYFSMMNQERKYLGRLFTGKKILALLNTLFCTAAFSALIYWQVSSNLKMSEPVFYGFIAMLFMLTLNAGYFFYAWHVNKTRINLEKCWDPLTGAWSRTYFDGLLQEEISRAGRYRHPVSLCLIDIDNFTSFNHSYGKTRANELLKNFSTLIRSSIRSSDLLGRYANDEFYLLLPHTDVVRAEKILSRIWDQSVDSYDCSFKAGITSYCAGEKTAQFKLRSQAALDHARRSGGKRISCLVGQDEGQAVLEF